MKGQRGAGHVEFIISFLLFILVVSLFLLFINPVESDSVFKTSLKSISESILKNVSSSVEIYGVKINKDNPEITSPVVAIDVGPNSLSTSEVSAKNLVGEILGSQRIGDEVYVEASSEEFVFFMFGFKENPEIVVNDFPDHNEDFYRIGSVHGAKVIFEKDLLRLVEDYNSDYDKLKNSLNIPQGVDFSFSIDFGNGEIVEAKQNIPLRLNVFSDVFRKEVIRVGGENVFVSIGVSIW